MNKSKQAKKSKIHTRKGNEIQKSTEPSNPSELSIESMADGTSVIDFAIVRNEKNVQQIMKEVRKIFRLDKLNSLKSKKSNTTYLAESKRQIHELWRRMHHLSIHASMFNVIVLIYIGKILDHVETHLSSKTKYMSWLRENFGYDHLRYFQHAKQLARMGEFAEEEAALGKNRLLNLARLTDKKSGESYRDILDKYPFEDLTKDHEEVLHKEHVDSIITYCRLRKAGIDFATFDQASLISSFLHQPIEVKKASQIKKWLDSEKNKKEAFENFLLNIMAYPSDNETSKEQSRIGLNKILSQVLHYKENFRLDDSDFIEKIKPQINETILVEAYEFISNVARKLSINLTKK